jgi:hypothetical protein
VIRKFNYFFEVYDVAGTVVVEIVIVLVLIGLFGFSRGC